MQNFPLFTTKTSLKYNRNKQLFPWFLRFYISLFCLFVYLWTINFSASPALNLFINLVEKISDCQFLDASVLQYYKSSILSLGLLVHNSSETIIAKVTYIFVTKEKDTIFTKLGLFKAYFLVSICCPECTLLLDYGELLLYIFFLSFTCSQIS